MRRFLSSRRAKLLVAVVAVLVVAGGAFAYFTASGSGTAVGAVATPGSVTITAGVAPTTLLAPGVTGDVTVSISNPNPIALRIPQLALDTSQGTGGFSVDAGHTGCALSTLSYTTQNNTGLGWSVPAKVGAVNGTLALDLTASITMSTAAANACQGATFTVFLKVLP